MKFDVIVSNPPYNKDMYLDFVETSFDLLNEDGIGVFITPAKFYAKGGAKNEAFRQKIMPHIKDVHLYKCCTDVFDIAERGGIAYYDVYKSQTFSEKIITNHNKNASLDDSTLLETERVHTEQHVEFMPLSAMRLIEKVKQVANGHTLFETTDLRSRYSYYCKNTQAADTNTPAQNTYQLMSGVGGTFAPQGYIYDTTIKDKADKDTISKYKLIVTEQLGTGNKGLWFDNNYKFNEKASIICDPNCIPKGSYTILYFADTPEEAQSAQSYVNSDFVQYLLIISAIGNKSFSDEQWRHVPALPATYPTDLTNVRTDYVREHAGQPCTFDHIYTNEELFDIFQLTDEERKLITSVIKPRVKK